MLEATLQTSGKPDSAGDPLGNHGTPFSQSKLHSNIGLALQICFVLKEVASWRASALRSQHFIAHGDQMQITQWIYGWWEASLMPTTTWPSN